MIFALPPGRENLPQTCTYTTVLTSLNRRVRTGTMLS